MGVLTRAAERRAQAFSGRYPGDPALASWYGGGDLSAAGKRVTQDSVLGLPVFWRGVNLIAGSVAKIPMLTYKRLDNRGRDRAYEHPLYRRLHDKPNRFQSAYAFKRLLQYHLLVRGNAYCLKQPDYELLPLHPDRMLPFYGQDNRRAYDYYAPDGKHYVLLQDEVVHLMGLSSDGLKGIDPISANKESLGAGLAAQEYSARFFENDATPGAYIKHPGVLAPEGREYLRNQWEQVHKGARNAHKVAVLWEGAEVHALSLTPEQSQLVATRQFDAEDQARVLGVQQHKVGILEHATFSNITQQDLEFLGDTLDPWLVLWEQTFNTEVLTERDQAAGIFAEFLRDAVLRMDPDARASAHVKYWGIGKLSINEIRAQDNQNPIEGGDTYFVPMNMVPLDNALDPPEPAPDAGEPTTTARWLPMEERSPAARQRLRRAYEPLFSDVASRIVRREVEQVGKAAKRLLATNDVNGFLGWVEQYYAGEVPRLQRDMLAVLTSYAGAVAAEAHREVSGTEGELDLGDFVVAYGGAFAARWAGGNKRQLGQLLGDTPADQMAAAIEKRLLVWQDLRPAEVARNEAVQAGTAFARQAFVLAGTPRLAWRSHSGACPTCKEMDGRSVGQSEAFVGNLKNPPLREGCTCDGGCRCDIVPVTYRRNLRAGRTVETLTEGARPVGDLAGVLLERRRKVVRDPEGRIAEVIESEVRQ